MSWRLRLVGLLCVALPALLVLADEKTSTETLWAEIYTSAWEGIYTADQAVQGESEYRVRCASCHGASLQGSEDAPPLIGPDFALDWNCANIADLFEKIQFTMPANRPGRLDQEQVADILAYILKANRFPAGTSALPSDADGLRGIRFLAVDPSR
jgi:S-disulfanyl-L-cysteine oxidoreductase SoxD